MQRKRKEVCKKERWEEGKGEQERGEAQGKKEGGEGAGTDEVERQSQPGRSLWPSGLKILSSLGKALKSSRYYPVRSTPNCMKVPNYTILMARKTVRKCKPKKLFNYS